LPGIRPGPSLDILPVGASPAGRSFIHDFFAGCKAGLISPAEIIYTAERRSNEEILAGETER
jgi:hypothetical protein